MAQYILRSPFSVEKMALDSSGKQITYRSKLGNKIFKLMDFLAVITQHIPDKGAQTIRYFGQYSNKSRGVRRHGGGSHVVCCPAIGRRVSSKQWREIIMRIWHVDPLRCPVCEKTMRTVATINDQRVIEKILRHRNAWHDPPIELPSTDIFESFTFEPCEDVDPMPDYESFPD